MPFNLDKLGLEAFVVCFFSLLPLKWLVVCEFWRVDKISLTAQDSEWK
jgi:hypothetical protein